MFNLKHKLIYGTRTLGYAYSRMFLSKKRNYQVFSKPGFDWFTGYYDVECVYQDEIFFHEVCDGNVSAPKSCKIMSLDLATARTKEIAVSHAVNWQLGSRLQVCGTDLVFNDIVEGQQVHRIVDLETEEQQLVDFPFWLKNKARDITITIDFERLWSERKGYGYFGRLHESLRNCVAICNYMGNKRYSSVDVDRICDELNLTPGGYLNHVIANDDFSYILTTYNLNLGSRRAVIPIVYNVQGDILSTFDPGMTFSHPSFISKYGIGYFDGSGYCSIDLISVDKEYLLTTRLDGHPTFFNHSEFITDTYPNKYSRMQIYSVSDGRKKNIANLYNHPRYQGDSRCDLHPKLSDGYIIFDLPEQKSRGFAIAKFD